MTTPAGYSGTPQARKLGLAPGMRVAFDARPPRWALADPVPDLALVEAVAPVDLVLAFFTTSAQLGERLPALAARIYPAGALWIAWPRRAGGHTSDITDTVVRAHVLPLGLVDTKIAAIDDDWSGQKAVWRLRNRTAATPPARPATSEG